MKRRILGFVPARGGSKGIPAKNLQLVGGKPLVLRAIEALKQVEGLDQIFLSTDCPRIAEIGKKAGAKVPFLRPKELASDESPVIESLHHTLSFFEKGGERIDWVVMVQPTSPFIKPGTISSVLKKALEKNLPVVQTVSPAKEHPAWLRVVEGDLSYPFLPFKGSLLRQSLPKLFVLNGAVNVYRSDVIRNKKIPDIRGYYVIDRYEGFDIDDDFDLKVAQSIFHLSISEDKEGERVEDLLHWQA